jgi:hypothetical protein
MKFGGEMVEGEWLERASGRHFREDEKHEQ